MAVEIRNRSIVLKDENRNANNDRGTNVFQMNKSTEVLTKQNGSEEKLQLKREVGLFSAVNLIVGVMIGKLTMSYSNLVRYLKPVLFRCLHISRNYKNYKQEIQYTSTL